MKASSTTMSMKLSPNELNVDTKPSILYNIARPRAE